MRTQPYRYRRELLSIARRCARAGWPVLPGAWWDPVEHRHVCDVPGCLVSGPHPALPDHAGDDLAALALTDPDQVAERWRQHPYAVLVPTGIACDVVELPARLGSPLLARLGRDGMLGPMAELTGRWFVFTMVGNTMHEEDLQRLRAARVIVHSRGSWVPLPPSLVDGRLTEWLWPPPPGPRWPLPSRRYVLTTVHTLLRRASGHGPYPPE